MKYCQIKHRPQTMESPIQSNYIVLCNPACMSSRHASENRPISARGYRAQIHMGLFTMDLMKEWQQQYFQINLSASFTGSVTYWSSRDRLNVNKNICRYLIII